MIKKTVCFGKPSDLAIPFKNDNSQINFYFSVVDSVMIGEPEEKGATTHHRLTVSMSRKLRVNWGLENEDKNTIKVLFQYGKRHIEEKIKSGILSETEEISLSTETCPDSCPFIISCISYPIESFEISLDVASDNLNNIHPNIQILIKRMENSFMSEDYGGVLHSSACIFETMAKDISLLPTIQNQTLKGFFERYRKDSNLPAPILDYILSIYNKRNTTPLAGHGSTQSHNISKEEALSLSEFTKTIIRIQYKLKTEKM